MVNKRIALIESTRNDEVPQVCDIVEVTTQYGDYYPNAIIESIREDGTLHVCLEPMIPFLSECEGRVVMSASGGPWMFIPQNLKKIETRSVWFKDWGHSGACANGAVHFRAKVNMWEYVKENPEHATKTNNKFRVYLRESNSSNPYRYIVTHKGLSYRVFRTEEEYQAWFAEIGGIIESIKDVRAAGPSGLRRNKSPGHRHHEQTLMRVIIRPV